MAPLDLLSFCFALAVLWWYFFEARADRMISYFLYSTFLYARPLKSICGHLIAADGWMDLGRIMLFDFQPSPQLRVGFRPTTPGSDGQGVREPHLQEHAL